MRDEEKEIVKDNEQQNGLDEENETVKVEEKETVKDEEKKPVKDEEKENIRNEENETINDEEKETKGDDKKKSVKDEEKETISDEEKETKKDKEKETVKDEEKETISDEEKETKENKEKETVKDDEKQTKGDGEKETVKDQEYESIRDEGIPIPETMNRVLDIENQSNDVDNMILNRNTSNIDKQLVNSNHFDIQDNSVQSTGKKDTNEIEVNVNNLPKKDKFYQDPLREWPNGTVYYEYSKTVNSKFRKMMSAAMKDIEDVSCIQFKLKNFTVGYWIKFYPSRHIVCSLTFDAPSLDFQMQIADDKSTKGLIIHDLLHTLGFPHMETANERDNYIQIQLNNVNASNKHFFSKVSSPMSLYNTKYDMDSIMHSSPTVFAKNKLIPTIIPIESDKAKNMGQRESKKLKVL